MRKQVFTPFCTCFRSASCSTLPYSLKMPRRPVYYGVSDGWLNIESPTKSLVTSPIIVEIKWKELPRNIFYQLKRFGLSHRHDGVALDLQILWGFSMPRGAAAIPTATKPPAAARPRHARPTWHQTRRAGGVERSRPRSPLWRGIVKT